MNRPRRSEVAIATSIKMILKTLVEITENLHTLRHLSREIHWIGLELDVQSLAFKETCRFLMQLDGDEGTILMDLGSSLWSEGNLNSRSIQFLGRKSNECGQLLINMQEDLVKVKRSSAHVSKGEQLNEIPGDRRHIVDIDFSKSICEKSVSSLMHHNNQLSALQAAL